MVVMLSRILGTGHLIEVQIQVQHKIPVEKTVQDILQEVGYQAGREVVNFSWAMNESITITITITITMSIFIANQHRDKLIIILSPSPKLISICLRHNCQLL